MLPSESLISLTLFPHSSTARSLSVQIAPDAGLISSPFLLISTLDNYVVEDALCVLFLVALLYSTFVCKYFLITKICGYESFQFIFPLTRKVPILASRKSLFPTTETPPVLQTLSEI